MKKLNPKQQNNMKIAGIIILVLLIVYFWRKRQQSLEQEEISNNSTSSGTPKSSTSSKPSWQKKYDALPSVGEDGLLKKGTKAKEVWKLQNLYNENISRKEGKAKLVVDGIFGSKTEEAVKYVTGYRETKLMWWRNAVVKTKAQREGAKSNNTPTPAFTTPIYQSYGAFPNYQAESTAVNNLYSLK